MIYFANPVNPATVAAMRAGLLGCIDTPAQGNARIDGLVWCADNGCYTNAWNVDTWWKWLQSNADRADLCRFATAPDVVGNAAATLELATPWLPRIRELGYPAAFVAQDGATPAALPWAALDAVFIGGTTTWKLGPAARRVAAATKAHGKWLHLGRVNSERRYRYAAHLGADSVDGTFLTFGPTKNLPQLLRWVRLANQPPLFHG